MPDDQDDIYPEGFPDMGDEEMGDEPGALLDPNSADARMAQIVAGHDPAMVSEDEDLFQAFAEEEAAAEERAFLAEEQGVAPEPLADRVVYRPGMAPAAQAAIERAAPGDAPVPLAAALAPVAEDDPWMPLLDMPGYRDRGARGEAIRALGTVTFMQLPCFTEMQHHCRDLRRDPLGQIHVMTDRVGDEGPALLQMAEWVRQGGLPLDAQEFRIPGANGEWRADAKKVFSHMPGYDPIVRMKLAEGDTYLLVEERAGNGCPADTTYVYCWKGGRDFYDRHPEHAHRLRQLGGRYLRAGIEGRREPVPAALAAPAPAQAERPAVPAAVQAPVAQPRPAQQAAPAPAALPAPAIEPDAPLARAPKGAVQVGAEVLAAAEAARPAQVVAPRALAPMQAFRQAGFVTTGTANGPALRRTREDGTVEQVTSADIGAGGRPLGLALAKRFSVALLPGPDAESLNSAEVSGADEALEWLAERAPGGLTPRR